MASGSYRGFARGRYFGGIVLSIQPFRRVNISCVFSGIELARFFASEMFGNNFVISLSHGHRCLLELTLVTVWLCRDANPLASPATATPGVLGDKLCRPAGPDAFEVCGNRGLTTPAVHLSALRACSVLGLQREDLNAIEPKARHFHCRGRQAPEKLFHSKA